MVTGDMKLKKYKMTLVFQLDSMVFQELVKSGAQQAMWGTTNKKRHYCIYNKWTRSILNNIHHFWAMYNKYGIFTEMRPPVVAEDSISPLRGQNAFTM